MPYQRRGDFVALVRAVQRPHGLSDELKWQKISNRSEGLYRDLIDAFFDTKWLAFHAIVCSRSVVRRDLHKSKEQMYQKHFTLLLSNKVQQACKRRPGRQHRFRVWVDPLQNSYSRAHEVVERITNAVVAKRTGVSSPVEAVSVRDSKTTESIQLCDVLLGAVLSAWNDEATASAKLAVQEAVASRLGWPDLKADTLSSEGKFNVWMFHDKSRERIATTRLVVPPIR